jgi:hypothetical protein
LKSAWISLKTTAFDWKMGCFLGLVGDVEFSKLFCVNDLVVGG